jgi:hypothetical protein
MGIIQCVNPDRTERGCQIVIRPMSKPKAIAAQWQNKTCKCGYLLRHVPCKVHIKVTQWSEGFIFHHSGSHDHPRPPEIRIDNDAKAEFTDLILSNPNIKPTALSVGGKNRKPVSDISSTLHNIHRVGRERKAVLKREGIGGPVNGDEWLEKWSDFLETNEEIIYGKEFGGEMVITLQNRTMRDFVLELPIYRANDPVAGLQTDGMHKYFQLPNSILISTSTYSPLLSSWVPVMWSYSNGSTQQHYYHHFRCLFRSIRDARRIAGQDFAVDDVAMVCDIYLNHVILISL